MANVEFTFNGNKTNIQCSKEEKMKDICRKFVAKIQKDVNILYFIYNGSQLNLELTFNQQANQLDIQRNEMCVLVNEKTSTIINESQTKSKDIICPKCGEICLINFNNYKVKLYDCKNSHETKNILLNEYNNTQIIYENNIICEICNEYNKDITYNKQFFKCLTCNKNICPICKSNHNNKHKIIDYDNKNYICEIHNDLYYSFCEDCKINLCMKCKSKHNEKHKIINYENILPDDDEIKEELNIFRNKIDKLNEDINKIIKMLKDISEEMEIYYKINYDLLNNYELQKRNYHILKNINFIKNNININDIDEIINNNNINSKFNNLLNIYEKLMNNNDDEIIYDNNKNFDNIPDNYEIGIDNKQMNYYKEINDNNEINIINEISNEIILNYKIDKTETENNEIKIFGKEFVENNKYNNIIILCEGKNYDLSEYFNIENYKNEKDILIIKLKNMNNITNVRYMFSECSQLLSISDDISNMDMTKFNDISNMFYKCSSLKSLPDISKWNISNINNIKEIFDGCKSLSLLPDISEWNVSNVTNINSMFHSCESLKSLPDISKWNTSKVTNMGFLFCVCESLKSLPDISKWNTYNVKNMRAIFGYCKSLLSLPDISKWNIDNVTNMNEMFNECKSLKSLPDISNWNTSNVTDMDWMFYYCSSLSLLPDLNKWNIEKVDSMTDIFKGCKQNLNIPQKFKVKIN